MGRNGFGYLFSLSRLSFVWSCIILFRSQYCWNLKSCWNNEIIVFNTGPSALNRLSSHNCGFALVRAMLNLNIHTSYFSHAVNYSHENVTFWYGWNVRTTIFEILKGTSFSQMSNFGRVKNSHVFVTSVKNLLDFSHAWQIRANSSHVWHILSNVKVKRICHKYEKFERTCHTCEEFERIFHICDKYVQITSLFDRSDFIFGTCTTRHLGEHSDQDLKTIRPVVLEEMR